MDLTKIVSISGYPEVFKIVKEARKGIIVESLLTGKRMQAFLDYKISALEDIAIFTQDGDIPLKEVFKRIYEKENGGKAPEPKDLKDAVKDYFAEIVPEYDRERVYLSDMKKVLRWYNMLLDKGLLDFSSQEEDEQQNEQETQQNENEE